jgi:hypothetical protein
MLLNNLIPICLLLTTEMTRAERLKALGSRLNQPTDITEILWFLVAIVALVAFLMVLRKVFVPAEAKPQSRGPDLFDRAIRQIELSRDDRELLTHVARQARLSDPAAILLSPANLAYAIERMPGEPDGQVLRRRLNSVCLRLFERPLPTNRQ